MSKVWHFCRWCFSFLFPDWIRWSTIRWFFLLFCFLYWNVCAFYKVSLVSWFGSFHCSFHLILSFLSFRIFLSWILYESPNVFLSVLHQEMRYAPYRIFWRFFVHFKLFIFPLNSSEKSFFHSVGLLMSFVWPFIWLNSRPSASIMRKILCLLCLNNILIYCALECITMGASIGLLDAVTILDLLAYFSSLLSFYCTLLWHCESIML